MGRDSHRLFLPDAGEPLPQQRLMDIAFTWEPRDAITAKYVAELVKGSTPPGFRFDDASLRGFKFDVDGYHNPQVKIFWKDVLVADLPAKFFSGEWLRLSMNLGLPATIKVTGDGLKLILVTAVVRFVEDKEPRA